MKQNCCQSNQNYSLSKCPVNGLKGKPIKLITLKSLLFPKSIDELDIQTKYYFCSASDCPVIYFNEFGKIFNGQQVKVPVFQKNKGETIPVCYCFNWTREKILAEINKQGFSNVENSIKTQVKAGNCHCEVNNPQGSCCLANVRNFVKDSIHAHINIG